MPVVEDPEPYPPELEPLLPVLEEPVAEEPVELPEGSVALLVPVELPAVRLR